MTSIYIVTDSNVRFSNPQFVEQHPIAIVPNTLEINGVRYKEDLDLTPEEAIQLIRQEGVIPKIIPPSVEDYAQVYARLIAKSDVIISIHTSRNIAQNYENARKAATQYSGNSAIAVIDSRMFGGALGMLVRVAAHTILETDNVEQIVKTVRGAIDRTYATYYVESTRYLHHNKIMAPSHSILSEMLGVRPFLNIEDGEMLITEKVRNQSQAVERLVEFLVEFTDIEDAVILQSKVGITEPARLLQDRLAVEFPKQPFPHTVYSASLAGLIGTDAIGVVVLEKELEPFYDDF